jgi:hypothetical protein
MLTMPWQITRWPAGGVVNLCPAASGSPCCYAGCALLLLLLLLLR